MSRYFIQSETLTNIADAIRAKIGVEGVIAVSDMASSIEGIEVSGGGFPNGTEWTTSNVTGVGISTVINANKLWVAAGMYNNGIYYSDDGVTWTQSNINDVPIGGIVFGSGIWVAYHAISLGGLYHSEDGKVWTNVSSGASAKTLTSVYHNGSFIIGTDGKGIWYSNDGLTWNVTSVSSGKFQKISVENGILLASDSTGGQIYRSSDGITWDVGTGADGIFSNFGFYKGVWLAGTAYTTSAGLYYSMDGESWQQSNITSGFVQRITIGETICVVSTNNGIYYSYNGKEWASSNVTYTGKYYYTAYSNGMWIAYPYSGSESLYYSHDGVEWESSDKNAQIQSIEYANGIWVAGTYMSGIIFSIDGGRTWNKTNVDGRVDKIIHRFGVWLASNSLYTSGNIYYSMTWSA